MKKTLTASVAFAISLLFFATSCTDKGQETFHYVNLSQVACSFLGEGSSPLAVDVKASPAQWTATPGATWVKIERTDERTLTITVDDNGTGAERNTTITIEAGQASQQIRVNQLPLDSEFARYRRLETFQMGAVMSPSGRYMGGFTASIAPDDSWQYSPTIVDTETDEVYEFGPFPESLYYLHQTMAITDQGLLFISDGYNGGQIAIDTSGEIFIPEAPAGYRFRPEIQATSADGKYWVGFAQNESGSNGGLTHPLLWIDGVPHELPMLDLNYRDEEIWVGVMARGISADGSIIYGTSWENYDYGMAYWDKDGNVDWVGSDLRTVTTVQRPNPLDGTLYDYNIVNGMICWANQTQISPNGTWIAGTYRTEEYDKENDEVLQANYPAFFNTETKTTTVFDEYAGCVAMGVTDDGLGLIGIQGMGVNSGFIVDLASKTKVDDMLPWIRSEFGIIISEGAIHYLTPDRQKVFGAKLRYEQNGAVTTLYWYVAPALNN